MNRIQNIFCWALCDGTGKSFVRNRVVQDSFLDEQIALFQTRALAKSHAVRGETPVKVTLWIGLDEDKTDPHAGR